MDSISRSALFVIAATALALPASAAHYRGHKTAHAKAHDALHAGPSDFVYKVTQATAKRGAPKPKPQVTARGLSLFDAVEQLGAYRGTIFEVESVPHGLAVRQRGSNQHHFEIVVTDCTSTNHPDAVEFQKRREPRGAQGRHLQPRSTLAVEYAMSIRIHWPSDIDAVAGYLPSKGFLDLEVEAHGHRYRLSFRDLANLQEGLRGAAAAGAVAWWEPGLVLLTEVSVENVQAAVDTLEANGAFKGGEFPAR